MNFLRVNQTYHGVGQGLFYSGSLSIGTDKRKRSSSSFHFVYDCGSESKKNFLEKEVAEYKQLRLYNGCIDLLVISHLHRDHINGLDLLLKGPGIKTKVVVLPYLEPAERILLMLSSERQPAWYIDFLRNPSRYLLDRGVEQIVYFSGRGEDGDIVPDPPPPPEGSPIEMNQEKFFPDLDVHRLKGDLETAKRAKMEDDIIAPGVVFAKDTLPLALRHIWQFSFYVAPVRLSKLKKFKKCAESLFLTEVKDTRYFIEILKNRSLTKELKDCYRLISNDLNVTSLGCVHGPVFRIRFSVDSNSYGLSLPFPIQMFRAKEDLRMAFCRYCDFILRDVGDLNSYSGLLRQSKYTMLLGDMDTKKEWRGLRRRYENYLSKIEFLQIPHHGSKYNWNGSIVGDINPQKYVITAALKNRHSHPHSEVVKNIVQANDYDAVEWVNEYHSFNSEKKLFL